MYEPQDSSSGLAPHPPLTGYYDAADDRRRYVLELFDRSAPHYNTIERLFLNSGLWYRRFSLRRAGLRRGMRVLDVAIGTAAVARGAARIVGAEGRVVGVDPSAGMLAEARRVFHGPVARGVAEALPFADASFDFVTMGIALRHVGDLATAFGEYLRVLRPGGVLWLLEGHVPASGMGRRMTALVWARLVPAMTLAATGSRDAKLLMDYYWETVAQCVPPATIFGALADVGFVEPRYRVAIPGAFAHYTARKASAGTAA